MKPWNRQHLLLLFFAFLCGVTLGLRAQEGTDTGDLPEGFTEQLDPLPSSELTKEELTEITPTQSASELWPKDDQPPTLQEIAPIEQQEGLPPEIPPAIDLPPLIDPLEELTIATPLTGEVVLKRDEKKGALVGNMPKLETVLNLGFVRVDSGEMVLKDNGKFSCMLKGKGLGNIPVDLGIKKIEFKDADTPDKLREFLKGLSQKQAFAITDQLLSELQAWAQKKGESATPDQAFRQLYAWRNRPDLKITNYLLQQVQKWIGENPDKRLDELFRQIIAWQKAEAAKPPVKRDLVVQKMVIGMTAPSGMKLEVIPGKPLVFQKADLLVDSVSEGASPYKRGSVIGASGGREWSSTYDLRFTARMFDALLRFSLRYTTGSESVDKELKIKASVSKLSFTNILPMFAATPLKDGLFTGTLEIIPKKSVILTGALVDKNGKPLSIEISKDKAIALDKVEVKFENTAYEAKRAAGPEAKTGYIRLFGFGETPVNVFKKREAEEPLETPEKKPFGKDITVEITAGGTFLGHKVALIGNADIGTRTGKLTAKVTTKASNIIPQLGTTELGKLDIEGTVVIGTKIKSVKQKGEYVDKRVGVLSFEGKISGTDEVKGVTVYGQTLKNARTYISFDEKKFITEGEFELFSGLKVKAELVSEWEKSTEVQIKIDAEPVTKEWKPFSLLPADLQKMFGPVKDLTISDLKFGGALGFAKAMKGEKATSASEKSKKAKTTGKGTTGAKISAMGAIYVQGTATLFGIKSQVFVRLERVKDESKGSPMGLLLAFVLPEGLNLKTALVKMETVPAGPNPVLDAFEFFPLTEGRFVISTADRLSYPGFSGDIARGVTLHAAVGVDATKTDNQLVKVFDALFKESVKLLPPAEGTKPKLPQAALTLTLDPFEIRQSKGRLALKLGDFTIKFGDLVSLSGGEAGVTISMKPELIITLGVKVKIKDNPQDLIFQGGVSASAVEFGGLMVMKGFWENPFGIRGFKFGNLGIAVKKAYREIVEGIGAISTGVGVAGGIVQIIVPSTFDITGSTMIGEGLGYGKPFEGEVFLHLTKSGGSAPAVAIKLKNVDSLFRIIAMLFGQMGVKIDPAALRQFEELCRWFSVTSVELKIAPESVSIGEGDAEIKLTQGVVASIQGMLMGKKYDGYAAIDYSRMMLRATIESFNIGPIKFSGTGTRKDPLVKFAASTSALPELVVNGHLVWPGIFDSMTDIAFTEKEIKFNVKNCVGQKGKEICTGMKFTTLPIGDPLKLLELKPSDIKLELEFSDEFSQQYKAAVVDEFNKSKDILQKSMNQLIEQTARNVATKDLQDQERRMKEAEGRQVYYFSSTNWQNPWEFGTLSVKRWLEYRHEVDKYNLMQLKYAIEQTPFGQFTRKVMDTFGITKALTDVLSVLKNFGDFSLDKGSVVVGNVAQLLTIKRIYWVGSFADAVSGVIPDVLVQVEIGGKERTEHVGKFDLRNPLDSMQRTAATLSRLTGEVLLNAFTVAFREVRLAAPSREVGKVLEKWSAITPPTAEQIVNPGASRQYAEQMADRILRETTGAQAEELKIAFGGKSGDELRRKLVEGLEAGVQKSRDIARDMAENVMGYARNNEARFLRKFPELRAEQGEGNLLNKIIRIVTGGKVQHWNPDELTRYVAEIEMKRRLAGKPSMFVDWPKTAGLEPILGEYTFISNW